MTAIQTSALLAGGLLGAALAMLVWHLLPAVPALGPALQRLHPNAAIAYRHPARRALQAVTDRMVPDADLAVLGRTRSHFLVGLGSSALIGLAMGPTLSAAMGVLGWRIPFAIPALGGVGLAFGCAVLVYRDVHAKADLARADYRRGVCIYLDQVALSTAAGHGPVESLERAATIGHGPVFDRIRTTLEQARVQMQPPWENLRSLGNQLRVPALGDLGDIMATSGIGGAHVYRTLRAKASGLRVQIRFDELAEAKAGSTVLDALGAALVLVLLLIAIYPFVSRLQLG